MLWKNVSNVLTQTQWNLSLSVKEKILGMSVTIMIFHILKHPEAIWEGGGIYINMDIGERSSVFSVFQTGQNWNIRNL